MTEDDFKKEKYSEKEIMDELKKQTRILKWIRGFVIALLSLVGVYIIFKIFVGSVFSQIIGLISNLF